MKWLDEKIGFMRFWNWCKKKIAFLKIKERWKKAEVGEKIGMATLTILSIPCFLALCGAALFCFACKDWLFAPPYDPVGAKKRLEAKRRQREQAAKRRRALVAMENERLDQWLKAHPGFN
jgi:hypothetical protein